MKLSEAHELFFEQAQFLSLEEFDLPGAMDMNLLRGLEGTRQWLERPMYFTRFQGIERHPNGDAVPYDSTAHAPNSSHKFYHTADGVVLYAKAQDFDCKVQSTEELFELYLQIERMNLWSAIGLYPFWRNPGMHVDIRNAAADGWRARWFRDKHGLYQKLTWKNFKQILVK